MTKALPYEVLALILLLCVWEVALGFLGSSSALRMFAAERPTVDLAGLAGDKVRPADGALHIPGAPLPPIVARLPGLELESNTPYLMAIRADAGRRFSVLLFGRDGEKPAARFRLPLRGEIEEFLLPLDAESIQSLNRLEIWNETSTDLVIRDLRFHELPVALGGARAAAGLLGPVALVLFGLRHRRSLGEYLRSELGQPIPDRRSWDLVTASVFFLVCFHVFLSAPVLQILDAKFNTLVSHRLITAGTLSLPESFFPEDGETLPYQLQRIDGKVYHFYPNAVAVLNVPFVAVFDWLGAAPVGPNGTFLRHRENRILAFAAAFQAAALCALLFALARLFFRPASAVALAALFAFGTQIFSSVSRAYWSHSWALLLMAAGIYLLISPNLRERPTTYVVSASLLSWSFFCRPPMSLSILGLVAYLAITRRRQLLWFAVSGLTWGALFAAYSLRTFHSLAPPYFLTAHLQSGVLGVDTLRRNYVEALIGTLLSPSRGLFVHVPFLVLVLALVIRYWRGLTGKGLALTALVVSFAHWQLLSANKVWWGGQSFGPRLFSDILVWFFLLTILAVLAWRREWSDHRAGWGWIRIAGVALVVGVSIFINFRGATAKETYHRRGNSVWDWRHPQFMAGLFRASVEKPLAERIADLRTEKDADERQRVLQTILQSESLEKRQVNGTGMLAVDVTWDKWTYGTRPAALVAANRKATASAPRLRLAVWASEVEYPITVFVEDGAGLQQYRFGESGIREIELATVPANSERLYVIWSDKAWSPGVRDRRMLGVQLLPPG